jgi:protein-tyrosine phosphatase
MTPSFRLLFICMGNICRSPAAEGVMRRCVAEAGLQNQIHIDSAGTGGWHAGNLPDPRMTAAAARRDYPLTSRARQVSPSDLRSFDLALVMDQQNLRDLQVFDPTGQFKAKVRLFCEFCTDHDDTEVPDPYYGGDAGFEKVLDLLEDGCRNLLNHIKTQLGKADTET